MQIPNGPITAVPQGSDAVATLNANMFPARLLRVTLAGVAGSRALVKLGTQLIDQTSRGQSNTNEFTTPPEIAVGMTVSITWPGQAANASQCSATFTIDR